MCNSYVIAYVLLYMFIHHFKINENKTNNKHASVCFRNPGALVQKLEGIQDLFSLLSQGAVELNSLFSLPIGYSFTTFVIHATIYLYMVITSLGKMTAFDSVSFINQVGGFLYTTAISVLILTTADLPVQEVSLPSF